MSGFLNLPKFNIFNEFENISLLDSNEKWIIFVKPNKNDIKNDDDFNYNENYYDNKNENENSSSLINNNNNNIETDEGKNH